MQYNLYTVISLLFGATGVTYSVKSHQIFWSSCIQSWSYKVHCSYLSMYLWPTSCICFDNCVWLFVTSMHSNKKTHCTDPFNVHFMMAGIMHRPEGGSGPGHPPDEGIQIDFGNLFCLPTLFKVMGASKLNWPQAQRHWRRQIYGSTLGTCHLKSS